MIHAVLFPCFIIDKFLLGRSNIDGPSHFALKGQVLRHILIPIG